MATSARIAQTESWTANFAERPDSFLDFSRKSGQLFFVSSVSADSKKEDFRFLHSFKHHRLENFSGGMIESRSSALSPFPVSRLCEYSGNSLKMTLDLAFPKEFSFKNLSVESVQFLQDCVELTILKPDFEGILPYSFETYNIRGIDKDFLWDSPPLAIIFKTESGEIIEIGTGDDIWRWNVAKTLSHNSSFLLSIKKGIPKFSRNLLCAASEEPLQLHGRSFRLTWYVAWHEHTCAPRQKIKNKSRIIDIKTDFEWPESALAISEKGKRLTMPCFHSNYVWNVLKKMIRQEIENGSSEIILKGVKPAVCFSASHLDRAKKKVLAHWNMMAMMKFWLWANKQAASRNAVFRFAPSEEEGCQPVLPSLSGMFS